MSNEKIMRNFLIFGNIYKFAIAIRQSDLTPSKFCGFSLVTQGVFTGDIESNIMIGSLVCDLEDFIERKQEKLFLRTNYRVPQSIFEAVTLFTGDYSYTGDDFQNFNLVGSELSAKTSINVGESRSIYLPFAIQDDNLINLFFIHRSQIEKSMITKISAANFYDVFNETYEQILKMWDEVKLR